MVEPVKKSTEGAVSEVIWEDCEESVSLDGRLALFYRGKAGENWLAVSDLHFGYEVQRRAAGALWPLWGKETVQSRLDDLISDYKPQLLILNGDIIDGAAGGNSDAIDWLKGLSSRCDQLILVKGNHDRGAVVRELPFVNHFQTGRFVFYHGHLPAPAVSAEIQVTGHIHPSNRFNDGAGLSIKLPTLVQEGSRWIMPAFSPWAGGVKYAGTDDAVQWACSPKRVFQIL